MALTPNPKNQKQSKQDQQKQDQKKPLGEPIEWSDADLEALATITEADKKAAGMFWTNAAPAKYKKLLDADVKEE